MRALTIVLILFLTSICFGQSEQVKTKIKGEIQSVMTKQASDWNRGDIDAFMQGYWRSDDLVFVSSNVTRGWQKTLDNYKKSYPTKEKMGALTFSDLEITVFSNDAAVVLGSWSLARAGDDPHGKFTLVFRKFKDGWRIVMDHTS